MATPWLRLMLTEVVYHKMDSAPRVGRKDLGLLVVGMDHRVPEGLDLPDIKVSARVEAWTAQLHLVSDRAQAAHLISLGPARRTVMADRRTAMVDRPDNTTQSSTMVVTDLRMGVTKCKDRPAVMTWAGAMICQHMADMDRVLAWAVQVCTVDPQEW